MKSILMVSFSEGYVPVDFIINGNIKYGRVENVENEFNISYALR